MIGKLNYQPRYPVFKTIRILIEFCLSDVGKKSTRNFLGINGKSNLSPRSDFADLRSIHNVCEMES